MKVLKVINRVMDLVALNKYVCWTVLVISAFFPGHMAIDLIRFIFGSLAIAVISVSLLVLNHKIAIKYQE